MDFTSTISFDIKVIDYRIVFYEIQEISQDRFKVNKDKSISWGHDEGRWNTLERDMSNLSKMFPDVLFTVDLVFEANEGFSRFYFKNGYGYEVPGIVTYPEFDESKLKFDSQVF